MKPNKVYVFFSDPGHGWLAVKRKELIELNIIHKVSECSYERGNTVYLEEDCDASLFIQTLRDKGIEIKYRESISPIDQSPIRRYGRFELRVGETA